MPILSFFVKWGHSGWLVKIEAENERDVQGTASRGMVPVVLIAIRVTNEDITVALYCGHVGQTLVKDIQSKVEKQL